MCKERAIIANCTHQHAQMNQQIEVKIPNWTSNKFKILLNECVSVSHFKWICCEIFGTVKNQWHFQWTVKLFHFQIYMPGLKQNSAKIHKNFDKIFLKGGHLECAFQFKSINEIMKLRKWGNNKRVPITNFH